MTTDKNPKNERNDQTIVGFQLTPEEPPAKPCVVNHKPFLIVIAGPNAGEMHCLQKEELLLGRDESCDVVLPDLSVSRVHAKIILTGGDATVIDLGSTNGTYVGAEKVTSHRLKDGEKVRIGQTVVLKFSYQDNMEEQFQRKLFDSATRDPLTRVYNRRYALDRLAGEVAHAKRTGGKLSLLMLDLDHFKQVNDTFGHPAGDLVLREMTRTIGKVLRNEDVFARYGGEEFVLILRDTGRTEAGMIAERLRKLAEEMHITYDTAEIRVTVSIGIACHEKDNFESIERLVAAADAGLYAAKHRGRNRVEYCP